MSENEYSTHGDFCAACDENLSVICERCYKDLITKLTEARAEVQRLRELLDENAYERGLLARRMTEAQARRDDAYRRGAEAMRDACVSAMRPIMRSMISRTEAALPIPGEP
jgi:chromosome segregation ATPase